MIHYENYIFASTVNLNFINMKLSVKYGLILGGVLSVIPLIIYGLGMEKQEMLQKVSGFANVLITAIVIYLCIKEIRDKQNNGLLSFGSGFSSGMMVSLVGGIISSIFSYIYFTVINPGMITYIKMKQEQGMLDNGMSEEQIEKMSGRMEFWSSPVMMAAFSLVGMLIIGLVISLICSAILKKEDPSAQIS